MRFLVFGLPRSRTGWLANMLTVPGHSMCLHEGLVEFGGSWGILKRNLDAMAKTGSYRAVGVADTGMIHEPEAALRLFPDAAYVVLTGAERSWKSFTVKARLPERLMRLVERDYENTCAMLKGRALFVDVDALTQGTHVMADVHEHCTGSLDGFDVLRLYVTRNLRVTMREDNLELRMSAMLRRMAKGVQNAEL